MAKREKEAHRLNLVIELELLETLRETARRRFNAPLHHISGQPEISATIIKLLELGLKALNDEDEIAYEDEKPVSLKDKYEGLNFRFNSLAENLDRLRDRVFFLESTHIPVQIPHTKVEEPPSLEEEVDPKEQLTHIPVQIEPIKVEETTKLEEEGIQGEDNFTHIPVQINAHIDSQIEGTKSEESTHIFMHINAQIDAQTVDLDKRESTHIPLHIDAQIEETTKEEEPTAVEEEIPIEEPAEEPITPIAVEEDFEISLYYKVREELEEEKVKKEELEEEGIQQPEKTKTEDKKPVNLLELLTKANSGEVVTSSPDNSTNDPDTKTKSQMAKLLGVNAATLGNWVKSRRWEKLEAYPQYTSEGWDWNPFDEVFERVM